MPHPAFARTDHRPWPLPERPWIMSMEWHDLLFAHWSVEPAAMEAAVAAACGANSGIRRERSAAPDERSPALPAGMTLDLRDGRAWLGVVPFRMAATRLRGTPPVPGPSAFPELNVRTYVTVDGRPGVFFFSLDAASRIAVRAARAWFHLPYFDAEMTCARTADDVAYRSRRTHRGAAPAAFEATYGPAGPVRLAAPGSLEHWLSERYCLYAVAPRRGGGHRIFRGEIHHEPWPLRAARAEIVVNSMAAAAGLGVTGPPESLLFVDSIVVAGWAPVRIP